MYLDWEIPNLIDSSSMIEGLYEENGKVEIYLYPNRFFIPVEELKVIIHPDMGGYCQPMFNKAENILFFSTAYQLKSYSSSRSWEIPEDFLFQFIVDVIEPVTQELELTKAETSTVTSYPLPQFLGINNIIIKNIGVATKTNLGIHCPGRL